MVLALIVYRAGINVLLPIAQHGVDDSGQLVRRGRNGLGWSNWAFFRCRNAPSALLDRYKALAARRRALAARSALVPFPHEYALYLISVNHSRASRNSEL